LDIHEKCLILEDRGFEVLVLSVKLLEK